MQMRRYMEFVISIITTALVVTATNSYECGTYQAFTDLIVGGKPVVDPAHWPWIVGVFHLDQGTTTFKCGATLVSRHVVVTAAHCVSEYDYSLDLTDMILVMGRLKIRDWTLQGSVQTRKPQSVGIHPSYLSNSKNGTDLAFLELESPIEVTQYVTPVCLWEEQSDQKLTSNNGTVVGWGRDEHDNLVTEYPRKSKLPIVDKQVCLDSNVFFKSFANEFTYCAGNRDGTGPCKGDSGSGMFVLRTLPDGFKSWVLRGVVSRSTRNEEDETNCDLSNYIVFSDMAKLLPWLTNTSCSFKYPATFDILDMKKLGDKYYFFQLDLKKTLNWRAAQYFCRSHGLQLASVETEEENDLIADYIKKTSPPIVFGNQYMWLGGSYTKRFGTWRWKSGPQFDFTAWKEGHPDYNLRENCLVMWAKKNLPHWWEDRRCEAEYGFVCELENECL